MGEEQAPFELLKTYSGLIHRQPLFMPDRLDVDSYHLSFLTAQGEKLNDDAKVPSFLLDLPNILPSISDRQKALLSMPESWRHTLFELESKNIDFTFDIDGDETPNIDNKAVSFAHHAATKNDDSHSNILLIDLESFDQQSFVDHLSLWRNNHKILCATNVNNLDNYTLCKSNHLDLLQGQFYTLPSAKDDQKTSPSTHILMELLVKLNNPEIEPKELAETINQDISLSYKLLRLINSAFFGLPREVSSTQQALVMLGNKKIKTWASLLSLSGIDDKPNELRIVAMTRAKMCELLAKHYNGSAETFFAAGLFSTLDALMDKPIAALLENLPLSAELQEALINRSGSAGLALQDVLNYEQGNWQAINDSSTPSTVLARAYLDAIHWAKELNRQLQD